MASIGLRRRRVRRDEDIDVALAAEADDAALSARPLYASPPAFDTALTALAADAVFYPSKLPVPEPEA